MSKYNEEQYKIMVSAPLETKIEISKERLIDEINGLQDDAYASFSGGKDSTVLVHLIRELYKEGRINYMPPIVFVDTPLEYPEIRQFVSSQKDVIKMKPNMTPKQVFEKYGYPIITKSQSMAIRKLRTQNLTEKYRNKLLYGDERGTSGKLSNKWHYLLDAPFPISEQCCEVFKKRIFHKYEMESGRFYPITAELATESNNRKVQYKKYGCNGMDRNKPKGTPLAFWNEQDILKYLKDHNVDYCSIYGEIKQDYLGRYYTTGERRTGCMFCGFGVHLEKQPNRFQRMAETHPKQYDYFINKLGMDKVLDYINVEYRRLGSIKEETNGQLRIV